MTVTTQAVAGVALGKLQFTFAVIADTHVNQEEGKASSDFAVNRLSNARNRHVMYEIARARPAFVVHLGDIVHPTPIHPGYAQAAASFRDLASVLDCPLHLVPGNHDVGDKPGDWLPVPSVNDDFLAIYREHFGANFHAFDAPGCRFIVVDAQIINSALACEAEQRAWLEQELAAHAGLRIFVSLHYPPFLLHPAEPGHYDNIDEPGRSWLLDLCRRHRVEALFAGHVHNFWYHDFHGTRMYLLPSTAFVRLDYSELFRIEAAPERGRNDAGKLGYLLVDVHEHGHVVHTIRTNGVQRAPDAPPEAPRERVPRVHTRTIARSLLGLELRYPWAETIAIPASGALDEFDRKEVRNDYPLLSLWEMGVRRLRVPWSDFAGAATRERMRVLRAQGHAFTVSVHGLTAEAEVLLREHASLIDTLEVIVSLPRLDALVPRLAGLRADTGMRVSLSRLQRHDSAHHHGNRARHVIQHGFVPGERDDCATLVRQLRARGAIDAVAYRLDRDDASLADSLLALDAFASAEDVTVDALVRLAADSPSVAMEDDLANANRVAEAMVAACACARVRVTLDTFNDVDRGYFPRTGLVDRRYNPRLAGHVMRTLHGALDGLAGTTKVTTLVAAGEARVLELRDSTQQYLVVLPSVPLALARLPGSTYKAAGGGMRSVDLRSGTIALHPMARGSDGTLAFAAPLRVDAPVLFRLP